MPSDDFAARVERVMQKRGAAAVALSGAGMKHMAPAAMAQSWPMPRARRSALGGLVSLVGAVIVGMGAVVLGNWARFHLQILPSQGQGNDVDLAVTLAVGLGLSILLRIIFALGGKLQFGFMLLGIAVMTLGFHNLHHWFPSAAGLVFSEEYAAQLRNVAPVDSLLIRGQVIPFAALGDLARL